MSKAVSFRSTKHASKNPVAAIVLVADEDFLAADRGEEDVETTNLRCPKSTVWIARYIFALRVHRQRNLSVREQDVSVKVVAAINSMNKQGHYARLYRHQDKMWVEIDQCMLASFHEIEELVEGVHSFEELAELFKRRHAEELGGL